MSTEQPRNHEVLHTIASLPTDWHRAGSLSESVCEAIVKHCAASNIDNSVETGSGKSTLLFSHLSSNHKVFAIDDGNASITNVLQSPLLNRQSVEFIEGPTQLTLPAYHWRHSLQAALIDGPHGYPFPDLEYYYIYPLLEPGAMLILDDIDIPTVYNMFRFIEADEMFSLIEVVGQTAFFRRTSAPTFDRCGDGWWLQNYNKHKVRLAERNINGTVLGYFKSCVPGPVKRAMKRLVDRKPL